MTDPRIHVQIRGGAEEQVAAAVIAAVEAAAQEEARAKSEPERRPVPPAWVRAGRRSTPDDWHPVDEIRPDPGRNWPR
jgi:hypothetical protein